MLDNDKGEESLVRRLDNPDKDDFTRGSIDCFEICFPRDEEFDYELTDVRLTEKTGNKWILDKVRI